MDDNSATVPAGATQAEEVRARWAWAEPSVWTDRMLTALEQGVKGGVWFIETPSLPSRGCSAYKQPTPWPVNPHRGEPSTGEPCAGNPHARFGGEGDRETGLPYPIPPHRC